MYCFQVLAKEKTFKKKPINSMLTPPFFSPFLRQSIIFQFAEQPQTESTAIKVTIDPAKINKHLGPTTIFVGLAIASEVKSIEEKGKSILVIPLTSSAYHIIQVFCWISD